MFLMQPCLGQFPFTDALPTSLLWNLTQVRLDSLKVTVVLNFHDVGTD